MNPENVGQNIKLRHSMIWRKPLIYQKAVPESKLCHLQLNQMGASGQFWRTRNVERQTESRTSKRKHRPSSNQKNLVKQQQNDHISQSFKLDASYLKGQQLVEKIEKMKNEKLIQKGGFTLAAYPAVGKVNFVYNDYHPKPANAGYSRNIKGKHFTS